tara:strand:+ start:705 stop:1283 length:579 start_codon:yes stop_codon:yes gene_type:complete
VTERKTNKKNEKSKVTTFPVPFTLEGINENITVNTNTHSREQIINQAFQFHRQGNISEAAKYYQYFINQGFNDHRVFSNYGAILQNNGKSKDAELSLRKAINLKPDYANSYLILASVLEDLDKLKEAELSVRKAIQIKPDFAEAHYKLGNTLKDKGKLIEAELSIRKAIKLNPELINAYTSLGKVLKVLEES